MGVLIAALVEAAGTISAVALSSVFAAAGAVKFTSTAATANDFAALGLGRSKALPLAVATAELFAAVALIVRPPLGAIVAAMLLVAFTGVVTWAVATDKQVKCGCFGPLSREPVSSATVLRNAVLLALAVIAGGQASLTVPDLASTVTVTIAVLTAVVIGQAVMTARRLGRLWTVELVGEMPGHDLPGGSSSRSATSREAASRTANRKERESGRSER